MALVLIVSGRIKDVPADPTLRIDLRASSSRRRAWRLLVYAILQSKTWGWVVPLAPARRSAE